MPVWIIILLNLLSSLPSVLKALRELFDGLSGEERREMTRELREAMRGDSATLGERVQRVVERYK